MLYNKLCVIEIIKLILQKGGSFSSQNEKLRQELHKNGIHIIRSFSKKYFRYILISERVRIRAVNMITTPKTRALGEIENMLVPVSHELGYDKALAEARDERYGYKNGHAENDEND